MSSRSPESPEPGPAIVDTVVLRYFVLVDRFGLLVDLLGSPINVSRIVFDPDDETEDEFAMNEIDRSVVVQRRRGVDGRRSEDERAEALTYGAKLATIADRESEGLISVVDMTDDERQLHARLASNVHAGEFGLMLALDDGEAASIAIAVRRGWAFVSDDSDALRALETLSPGHPYQRIRRLLIEANAQDLISQSDANGIHAEMRQAGFWDKGKPFQKED